MGRAARSPVPGEALQHQVDPLIRLQIADVHGDTALDAQFVSEIRDRFLLAAQPQQGDVFQDHHVFVPITVHQVRQGVADRQHDPCPAYGQRLEKKQHSGQGTQPGKFAYDLVGHAGIHVVDIGFRPPGAHQHGHEATFFHRMNQIVVLFAHQSEKA